MRQIPTINNTERKSKSEARWVLGAWFSRIILGRGVKNLLKKKIETFVLPLKSPGGGGEHMPHPVPLRSVLFKDFYLGEISADASMVFKGSTKGRTQHFSKGRGV